ncbi:hypothetical protein G1C97_1120 [Bifidobacterium sp. DSM 109959]|uniref:Uncharacterized protein n=2 Tax=Bifidobacterium olomucense TaxID=2675324 RepID=A0A7Y0EZD3_9BIFI|nr:hypothetical protein [Bifidobacterium sp. DSM 109959]
MAGERGTVSERLAREFFDEMDALARAPLWWVSEDMKKLCVDTVENGPLPPVEPLPTATGLIVFEGGVVFSSRGMADVPVAAVSWERAGSMHGGVPGVMIRLFGDSMRNAMGRLMDKSLPIAPMGTIDDETLDASVITLLSVAFALMGQPSVTAVSESRWDLRRDGPQPRSMTQAAKVKMIVLRPPARTSMGNGGGAGRRAPDHRYIVRGFYRNQQYGPNNSLRRRQWIPPYVKGPAGTPLIVKESVRIWRRL